MRQDSHCFAPLTRMATFPSLMTARSCPSGFSRASRPSRLERRAVVLCVNDSEVRERARERLYVGMSRATDELVVVGHPEVVREMGGDAVARQLGIPPSQGRVSRP